ncbi:MAG: SufD family Fe-S cluster assembly protein, partial [Bacteroidales bacterium]|nr:SufD family Fe-S cluster assembly protein [Bacteroidales bacterium]
QKTKAYQENHSILLSRDAIVETSPQLEIYADDVECSHGATVGYLSELEQFYMRSRGIPLADARRLQILSFLSPVSGGLVELDEKICHAVENAI